MLNGEDVSVELVASAVHCNDGSLCVSLSIVFHISNRVSLGELRVPDMHIWSLNANALDVSKPREVQANLGISHVERQVFDENIRFACSIGGLSVCRGTALVGRLVGQYKDRSVSLRCGLPIKL